jgi:hypothetical protein
MEKQNAIEFSNFEITGGENGYVDVTKDKLKVDCTFKKEIWLRIKNIPGDNRFYYEVSCYNNVRNIFNHKLVNKFYINDEEYVMIYKDKLVKVANLFSYNFQKLMEQNMKLSYNGHIL